MTTRQATVTALLSLFNATSALAYASVLLLIVGDQAWRDELLGLATANWDEEQGALAGAFVAGGAVTPVFLAWLRRLPILRTCGLWAQGGLSGIAFGYFVVVLASVLAPGMIGIGAIGAQESASRMFVQILLVPVGILLMAAFGLFSAPAFAILATPVVLLGGALNGTVCLAVLRTSERRS